MLTVSVVTPSLDQAEFLPGCLASVAEQRSGVLEHLVFDPGSVDASRSLISAAPHATLVAEEDDGQADAVRRGFARARGDVLGWLNADDRYVDDQVLARVLARFAQPDKPDVVYGRGRYVSSCDESLGPAWVVPEPEQLRGALIDGVGLLQPAVFIRRSALDRLDGGPDAGLDYALDYDLWIRAVRAELRFAFLDRDLACATVHDHAKTQSERRASLLEALQVSRRHHGFTAYGWQRKLVDHELTGADGMFRTTAAHEDPAGAVERATAAALRRANRNAGSIVAMARHLRHRAAQKTALSMAGLRVLWS